MAQISDGDVDGKGVEAGGKAVVVKAGGASAVGGGAVSEAVGYLVCNDCSVRHSVNSVPLMEIKSTNEALAGSGVGPWSWWR